MAKNTPNNLTAAVRKETGKGASRRARRNGKVPAVLYGHGSDPQHLELNARDFAAVLRHTGTNAVLTLDIEGNEQLALTRRWTLHPIRRSIEHADLLVVRRGEKVTVEVNVIVEGEAIPGTLVTQDANTIQIEADVQSIPDKLTVSVEGADVGTQFTAGPITLPDGVALVSDPETLVVNVVAAPTAEEMEGEGAGEAAEEAAEGEAGRGRSRRRGRRLRRGTRRGLRVTESGMAEPQLVVGLGNPERSTPPRGTTSASSSPTSWPIASARGSRCTRSRGPTWSPGASPAARW